jgi:hypothetical protein
LHSALAGGLGRFDLSCAMLICAGARTATAKSTIVRRANFFMTIPPKIFLGCGSQLIHRDRRLPKNYTHSCIYNLSMAVFDEKQEELEHFETRMGIPRGRLAVTMDLVTDAMALVGQHGVYCQSQRWPGKPVMDIQMIMKSLTDAKELIQSVMEELRTKA